MMVDVFVCVHSEFKQHVQDLLLMSLSVEADRFLGFALSELVLF